MVPDLENIAGVNRHETEYLYEEIFVRQSYLPGLTDLPEGAVVFDVGANIGMYSLFVSALHPSASLYSFEPVPPVCEVLRRNLARHSPGATVFDHGLSDGDRREEFVFYPGYTVMSAQRDLADTSAEKSFVRDRVAREGYGESPEMLDELLDYRFREESHRCRLRRLSDVLDECGVETVDVLKIDVQRAELDVLRGIDDRHWPAIRQVIMEVHDDETAATAGQLDAVTAVLERQGLRVTRSQDELLKGSDRHTLFAVRSGGVPASV
ncbi:methyltransferase, FkbM family [Streptomyces zhaozhouensis]|uniref:Methyltransferase, FkbM family n=1 Tax=Streptomyces zhaozhouensis TaxID=1300267 RepID=A0A286DN29_9ACTN|nr:FkbM family methyltransferase [Streptomyces zhaozhouensis]SOD60092.1 methyltransferase, FkbM family [Streptomyces zhaozhouensis]